MWFANDTVACSSFRGLMCGFMCVCGRMVGWIEVPTTPQSHNTTPQHENATDVDHDPSRHYSKPNSRSDALADIQAGFWW